MANYTINLKLEKPDYNETADIEVINRNMDKIDSEMMFKTATGSGTEITINLPEILADGYNTTFIASANNSGASTTVNGKKLYKPNTKIAPNLTSGKAYSIWYNSASNCFFVQASAEGNAQQSSVLAGATFSNDNDTGLVGTMPNNGDISGTLNAGCSKVIPAGYTTGGTITANSLASQTSATATASQILSGKTAWVNGSLITGNIASLGATIYTPSTSNQTIASGKYLSGTQTIKGDANLVSSNIVDTSTIFGVKGSANIASLGGVKYAEGVTSDSTTVTISGIGFAPTSVYLELVNGTKWYANKLYVSTVRAYPVGGVSSSTLLFTFNSNGFTAQNYISKWYAWG